ncbi:MULTISPECIES: SIR2 family protein [Fusobacterium]|uniref:SIR2 family protein n=1 Tax=Fusobacterium TaxID=848 RepID=UPI0028E4D4FB|nr:SIR2 family protein [Fusobacterium pseudoperiodonticum]
MDSKNENTENLSKKKVPNKDEEFNNFFFVGGDDWIKNEKESISKEKKNKIKLFLKKYLLLDNVNFLFGTGSSIHLGAETVQRIPEKVTDEIEEKDEVKNLFKKLKNKYVDKIKEEIRKGKDYFIWEDKVLKPIIDKIFDNLKKNLEISEEDEIKKIKFKKDIEEELRENSKKIDSKNIIKTIFANDNIKKYNIILDEVDEILKNITEKFKIELELLKLINKNKINLKEIAINKKFNDEEKEKIYKLGIEVKLEDFLNYLYALKYLMEQSEGIISKEEIDIEKLEQLIETIKKAIFEMCDIDNISFEDNLFFKREADSVISARIKIETRKKMEKEGKYTYHRSFLTSLLQRPLNLRRANIFTLNYDLAFEYACDELGIEYINGFVGFNERNFRPEVYNYDFFFPGDTTEGKVRRIERVIKYYKLHGSLNWVYKNQNKNNPYGLYEIPIELVRMKLKNKMDNLGEIMIYPTSSKKEYTLNFPYSELFRKFADRLQQPEAVLFVIGYSFYDEHVNDIIYQALANPSFTLVIVDFNGTQSGGEIKRLNDLKDPRIIISQGGELGDFKYFSKELLPTMDQEDTRAKVMSSIEKLYPKEDNEKSEV